jgi:hypothetical protein
MVLTFNGLIRISLSRKNLIPILLHVHYDPAHGIRPVEGLVEGSDVALAVVGILAIGIGVVNKQPQSSTFAGLGVFDHLHVGIGIAEGQDRPAADVLIDTHRLARLIVDEVNFRLANEYRLTIFDLEFGDNTSIISLLSSIL